MSGESKPSSGLDATIPAQRSRAEDSGSDVTVPATAVPAPASDDPRRPSGEIALPPARRYRIGTELGRGGMGRVVEAFDSQLGRAVALKEVLPAAGGSVAQRFRREILITARLEHASIVPLYDAGVMPDGRPFYVMRRVSGRPLDQLIAGARGLAGRLALLPNVLAAIDAIGHAHRRGVLHRDLKPANILVGELGETVVIDWGLAKVIGEDDPPGDGEGGAAPSSSDSIRTQVGSVFGTPGFMAPEQARGEELDKPGDVYALGATLYQLLAGKPPVAGTSATELLASTMRHAIQPLSIACPDAPPELATIIDKALAADPADRYADAGALAEDVRRFTTGQLVAAHQYTRRQRLARFARRHRAALAVTMLASVAVAVLAWISVHRILGERDVARRARAEAELQRSHADARAAELRQRADQLVLAHARGLLDSDPTHAVALLKQLEGASPAVVEEAKAIAKAAIVRGATWGVRSLSGPTSSLELTRDAKRLLQANRDGELQVVDLELRRVIITARFAEGSRAVWVDGDRRILVHDAKAAPVLFEPVSGARAAVATGPLRELAASADGAQIAFVDANGHVGVLEVATGAIHALWTTGAAQRVAIAPDGTFVAIADRGDRGDRVRAVVLDRTGRVVLDKNTKSVHAFAFGDHGRFAVASWDNVEQARLADPAPAFAPIAAIGADTAKFVFHLAYRGDQLDLWSSRALLTWTGTHLASQPLGTALFLGGPAGDGAVVVAADDHRLHLLRGGIVTSIPLRGHRQGVTRVATVPGVSRFVATSGDALQVWEVDRVVPRTVPASGSFFLDDRHVFVTTNLSTSWYVLDVDSGAKIALPIREIGLVHHAEAIGDGRLLLALEHARVRGAPAVVSAAVYDPIGNRKIALDGLANDAALVPGDAVVYGAAGGRVLARIGTGPPTEVAALDGEVRSVAALGHRRFAALSTAGELVAGSLLPAAPGGAAPFARTRIDYRDQFVAADTAGDVLVAQGNRLLRWRGDVHEIARFAAEPAGTIAGIKALATGFLVTLANDDVYFVAARGDQTPRRVPLTAPLAFDHVGLLAKTAGTHQIELVDTPSLALWSLPKVGSASRGKVDLSAGGKRVLQLGLGLSAVWELPAAGRELGAWLDEITNAQEHDGRVVWPWQPRP